jgi:hypothetical protein
MMAWVWSLGDVQMGKWWPLLLVLAGCTAKEGTSPFAVAGDDQIVTSGVRVFVDGSSSTDADGTITKYNWTLASAPTNSTVSLTSDGAMSEFVVDVCGRYLLALQVTDNDGNASSPDMVEVICTSPADRPIASLSAHGVVGVGLELFLDGVPSTAPNGAPVSGWTFTVEHRPEAATATPTASGVTDSMATLQPDAMGMWIIGLVVTDGIQDSRMDTIEVWVAPEPNQEPVSVCGADQHVTLGTFVTLDGSGSLDPEGDRLDFDWSLERPDASYAPLNEPTTVTPRFQAGEVGIFVASLVVSDASLTSAPCTTRIQVSENVGNRPPMADAGGDISMDAPGAEVALNGEASFDPDGDPITPRWSLSSAPLSSSVLQADIIAPNALSASFTPDVDGVYILMIEVCDPNELCATDATKVTIGASDNHPPIANAGSDREAEVGVSIPLDGSLSQDPDGDALTFQWTLQGKPAGSSALIADDDQTMAAFSPDIEGTFYLRLEVSDGEASASDWVTVNSHPEGTNLSPVCNTNGDQTTDMEVAITVDASGSFDPNADPLSFTWSVITAPSGRPASFDDPTAPITRFRPIEPGDYVLQFLADDGAEQCTASVVVTVIDTSPNQVPDCDAGGDLSIEMGLLATLDGSASSDPDGDLLSFSWSIHTTPGGSSATLDSATTAVTSFTPDRAGVYEISLTVSDGEDACTEWIVVDVRETPTNAPPNCIAGPDSSATVDETITLDGSGSSDPDGDVLTYLWSFTTRPEGSVHGIIERDSAVATFIPDVGGTYVAQLQVSDGTDTCTDVVTLTIAPINTPPTCDAGTAIEGIVGENLRLDASDSIDLDGDSLEFTWSFTIRPEDSINGIIDRNSVVAGFIPDVAGSYVAQVTVSDGIDTCTDTVDLTVVSGNVPPSCDAGPDQSIVVAQRAYFDGTGSSDADDDPLSYAWSFASRPDTSVHGLIDRESATASFIPDVAGTYTLVLSVSDGEDTCTDQMVLTVAPNTPPTCDAGPDLFGAVGERLILNGSGTSDPDGDALTYIWSFTSRPEASVHGIVDRYKPMAAFTPDVGGSYALQIFADDGTNTCVATALLVVESDGSAPVADAGRDIILCDTTSVGLDGSDSTGASLSYAWVFSDTPTGSTLTDGDISDANTSSPDFSPDIEGRYVLELTVSNSAGADTDAVAITLNAGGSVMMLHLDEGSGTVAVDGSPAGNDGVISEPIWTGGRFFDGLGFEGTNHITIPDDDSLDFESDFSIDWWMQTDEIGDDWRAVLTKGEAYNYSLWTVGNQLYLYTVTSVGSYVFVGGTADSLGDGKWHHYAATIGDGRLQLFEDGVLLATEVLSSPLLTNTAPLTIGRSAASVASEFFVGALDEIVIQRGVLTEDQIVLRSEAATQVCTGAQDIDAPTAAITSPPSGRVTEVGYVKVEGTADDASAIASVSVNGATAAATSRDFSNWVAYVPLAEGSNTLVVRVEDVAGNVNISADSVLVTFEDVCGDDTVLLLSFDEDNAGTAADWGPEANDADETGVGRVIGRYGNALSLNGSGEVTVSHSPGIAGGDNISLEMWMRRYGDSPDLEVLATKGDPSTYGMAIYGDMLIFGFDDADLSEYATVTTGVTDGLWHHVVGVFDGLELSLYVDGVFASATPTPGAIPATHTQDLAIGSFFGLGAAFDGEIDQLRVYDHALSASAVVDLFSGGEACPIGDNLALLGTASASSTLNPLFSPANTIDDETLELAEVHYTMWLGENDTSAWVELDLGDVVGVIRVRWSNTHNRTFMNRATTRYRIEASVTGNFSGEASTIATGTDSLSADLAFHTEEGSPVAARYLRFYADEWEGLGPGVNEIQVFGLE